MRSGFCLLFAVVLLTATCARASSAPLTAARDLPAPKVVAMADDQVTVNVLELFCRSCAEVIITRCRDIYGVTAVDVDRKAKLLTLHFESSVTSRDQILAAVDGVVANIP